MAVCAPADAQQSALMSRHEVAVANRPNAVCNDGTRPVFYFQPGIGDAGNKWVFWFEGGGGCSSDASCRARAENAHDLTSSADRPNASMIPEGILSTVPKVNPDFASYAHVYVHYCTSDMYAGDTERQIDGKPWQFRGAEVVQALLDQLTAQPIAGAPTLATATDVLVTGSSAGAQGVHNNLDRIAARLPQASVKGIADAGWSPLASQPYVAPGATPVRRDPAATFAYLNARPDESCLAANPTHPGDCLNEQFAFPYIATPMLVYADQKDPALLEGMNIRGGPQNPAEAAYVDVFAKSVRDTLAAEAPAYFAPDRNFHTVLPIPEYATVAIDGVTFGGVLHRWYFGIPGNVRIAASHPER
jgi:hypothetical protein